MFGIEYLNILRSWLLEEWMLIFRLEWDGFLALVSAGW